MVTSSVFAATHAQFVVGQGGGPAPPPPPPPPAASAPMMAIDVPTANATVSSSFALSGWALDRGAPAGTGVDVVHAWAFPTTGAGPIFLGAAAVGVARPDVGAYLGDGRFSGSGFGLTPSLPAGTYDLRVYAFSTVARTFNNSATTRITVAAPQSIPRMFVDTPAQFQTITQNVSMAGWAIDLASASGPGVEVVHVWAYPLAGGGPLFLGASGTGYSRPDIAAHFGARFGSGGFHVTGTLPPGEYNLVVHARSALTGTFNQAALVRVRVV
jgi:hypothetical protein